MLNYLHMADHDGHPSTSINHGSLDLAKSMDGALPAAARNLLPSLSQRRQRSQTAALGHSTEDLLSQFNSLQEGIAQMHSNADGNGRAAGIRRSLGNEQTEQEGNTGADSKMAEGEAQQQQGAEVQRSLHMATASQRQQQVSQDDLSRHLAAKLELQRQLQESREEAAKNKMQLELEIEELQQSKMHLEQELAAAAAAIQEVRRTSYNSV